MATTVKLYRVSTVAPELRGCRNVTLDWFVDTRVVPAQRPGDELVEGYVSGGYHDGAIDELFDAAEAEALVAWLKTHRPAYGEATIAEAKLPLSNNCMGFGAIPVGGLTDFLVMKDATSSLGFTVLGYFDLRGHERIAAESGVLRGAEGRPKPKEEPDAALLL